ncbi:MAG: SpoIIE family protein phosphatase [Deltaproteobacteria bacterium]|nr:SpoIIE family protein phosphatase [Deltaproteobacteria bacterium]
MILLVDDEVLNRKLLQWSLSKAGYEFIHATNGHEAIKIAQQGGVDIILLDLMMPELDGFGFLEWKNSAPVEIREIPVIVNSALSDMDSIKRALNMGAYDYFSKPLSSDALEVLLPTKVKNAIESSRALRALRQRTEELNAELQAAERFQTSMLPSPDQYLPLRFQYLYRPCSLVGGDFFDVYRIDANRIALFIGDVTGHGLKAGMMSFMVKSIFRELASREPAPRTLVDSLNRALCQVFDAGHYITGVYGVFDFSRNVFEYANCAHPRPLLVSDGEAVRVIEGGGHFLGMMEDILIETGSLEFAHGARLLMYTDGVTEALDTHGAQIETNGLARIVESLPKDDPAAWCAGVWDKVVERTGKQEFVDDVLVVACWADDAK